MQVARVAAAFSKYVLLHYTQVARVAAAYVAPFGLLVHVVAAPYLYTVVVTCPEALWCAPTEAVTLPAALMAAVGVLLLLVWQVTSHEPY